MKSVKMTGRRAISYVRFSSPKQEHGFSLARQLEGTRAFCQRHNLFLDETLSIQDLGKSAFRGANAVKGNLGIFIEAVRQKKILPPLVLVVEALDRITRNDVLQATRLLTNILEDGIDIGLVSEDKVYSYDYIVKNPYEFIVATTYLIRGSDESRMKSERVKDAWVRKKTSIREKKAVVKIPAPCWLRRKGDQWAVVEEKAKVVRQIFADYLKENQGIWMLSQSLNQRRVPVITQRAKPGSKWHRITMHRILTDKAVIGTYTRTEPPVENYFPPVVSEKDFYAVQAKLKDRRQFRGRHSLKDISLFKGLCKCSKCGATMTRITRTRKTKAGGSVLYRYLYCHNSILGLCNPARAVDLTKFENAFLRYTLRSETANLFFDECYVDRSLQKNFASVEGQIADKSARRDRLVAVIEEGSEANSQTVLQRINALENEIKMLENKKESLKAELNRNPNGPYTASEYITAAGRLVTNEPADRLRLRELTRQFVRSMVVDPERRTAVFTTIAGKTREMTW
jgi:DNA invertase Pin-like site-specific DNA recombinase